MEFGLSMNENAIDEDRLPASFSGGRIQRGFWVMVTLSRQELTLTASSKLSSVRVYRLSSRKEMSWITTFFHISSLVTTALG